MKKIKTIDLRKGDTFMLDYTIGIAISNPYLDKNNFFRIDLEDNRSYWLGNNGSSECILISRTEIERPESGIPKIKSMSKEELLDYILFRASGINQAPNYTYQDFHREMVELVNNAKRNLATSENEDGSRL